MSASLNRGLLVIVRHALSTSMFCSLCFVIGNFVPWHATIAPEASLAFRSPAGRAVHAPGGANADSAPEKTGSGCMGRVEAKGDGPEF